MRPCRNLELRIKLDEELIRLRKNLKNIHKTINEFDDILPVENRLSYLKEDIMIYMTSIANIMKRYLNFYYI